MADCDPEDKLVHEVCFPSILTIVKVAKSGGAMVTQIFEPSC